LIRLFVLFLICVDGSPQILYLFSNYSYVNPRQISPENFTLGQDVVFKNARNATSLSDIKKAFENETYDIEMIFLALPYHLSTNPDELICWFPDVVLFIFSPEVLQHIMDEFPTPFNFSYTLLPNVAEDTVGRTTTNILSIITTSTIAYIIFLIFFPRKRNKATNKMLYILLPASIFRICNLYIFPMVVKDQCSKGYTAFYYINAMVFHFQEIIEMLALLLYLVSDRVFITEYLNNNYRYFYIIGTGFTLLSIFQIVFKTFSKIEFFYPKITIAIIYLMLLLSLTYFLIKGSTYPPNNSGQWLGFIILLFHIINSAMNLANIFVSLDANIYIDMVIKSLLTIIPILKLVGIYRSWKIIKELSNTISKSLSKLFSRDEPDHHLIEHV